MPSNINIDAILSDPLLLIAVSLLVLGPLVFFVALIKWLRSPQVPLSLPHHDEPEADTILSAPPIVEEEKNISADSASPVQPHQSTDESRVTMPPISVEVQGQIEIVFSQIKTLSKKVAQLESEMESVSRTAAAKLETNELKEVPMNPADFTQKLLKLAEHVIVLEKEVARLKSPKINVAEPDADSDETVALPPQPVAPSGHKPPIMPI